jgi:hypothetical protein
MKKILYNLFVVFLMIAGFSSCEEETTYDTSKITYYATLELQGEIVLFWDKGVAYDEPGYVAKMQGEDVTSQVEVIGSVDVSTPGIYDLSYVITNKDDYSVTQNRTVMVADPTESPIESGYWSATSETYRDYGGTITQFSGFSVSILQTAPGEFYISDFFAGYFDQRAGYGSAYACVGSFSLSSENVIEATSASVEGWGDSIDELRGGTFNPETGEIYYEVDYIGLMTFYITLTKN